MNKTLDEKYAEACEYFKARGIDPFNMQNGIKNTETATKYDPCRLFRKGDIVKPCQVKGRWHSVTWVGRSGIHFTVTEDEEEDGIITIKDPDCKLPYITSAVFFELVTPVEELEKSRVFNDKKMGAWIVTKDNFTHAYFPYRCEVSDNIANSKEEAKAAAEAECNRLNAEWRKERENG